MVLLIVAVMLWWPASAPVANTRDAGQTPARGRSAQPAAAPAPVPEVKLGTLTQPRETPGEVTRNPFRFQPRSAPPARPVADAPSPTDIPVRPAPPPGPPPVAPVPLKLIGVLERANGVKWAVLSDGKNAPMYGKDGDIVDGRYQIVKIGTESIEMTYVDGRGRTVIRLTGQ